MFKWAAQIGCSKGVINDERDAGIVSDISNGADVQYIAARVADGFTVEGSRARGESAAIIFRVGAIHEDRVNTPGAEGQVELCVGTSVKATGRDQIISGTKKSHHCRHLCCHTRGGSDRACSALKRCNALLENCGSWVHNTCINIAETLQRKEMGRVVGVVKDK